MTNELVYDIARQKALARLFEANRRRIIKDLCVCARRDCTFDVMSVLDRGIDGLGRLPALHHISAAVRRALA